MTNLGRPVWWKGQRGEWLAAGQAVLMALVFLGPRTLSGDSAPLFRSGLPRYAGAALVLGGSALLIAGIIRLGPGLTPLPFPKDDVPLVQSGPFAWVRHPMVLRRARARSRVRLADGRVADLDLHGGAVRAPRCEIAPGGALARREVPGIPGVPAAGPRSSCPFVVPMCKC